MVPCSARRGFRRGTPNLVLVAWYIVLCIVALSLFAGWRLDRKDHATQSRSRRASDISRDAMRYRQAFRSSRRR